MLCDWFVDNKPQSWTKYLRQTLKDKTLQRQIIIMIASINLILLKIK